MRISDWSSDVCSSDLLGEVRAHGGAHVLFAGLRDIWLKPAERLILILLCLGGHEWTASTLVIHYAGLLHHRHLPALRLQAGELTRSNRAALLPVVEPAVAGACEGWSGSVRWGSKPAQCLILVKPGPIAGDRKSTRLNSSH